MKNDRQHASLDGAELFEYLSLEVAKRYWGGLKDTRVDGLVFGTARLNRDADDDDQINAASFSAAVGQLSDAMREGNGYKAKDPPPIKARDAKLDLAVWRDFADQCSSKKVDHLRYRHGKLIGFGQCKTGNTWHGEVEKLQPEKFCENWFRDSPLVKPVKLFFVSDRFVHPWHEKTRGMIFFDRCRILDTRTIFPPNWLQSAQTGLELFLRNTKLRGGIRQEKQSRHRRRRNSNSVSFKSIQVPWWKNLASKTNSRVDRQRRSKATFVCRTVCWWC